MAHQQFTMIHSSFESYEKSDENWNEIFVDKSLCTVLMVPHYPPDGISVISFIVYLQLASCIKDRVTGLAKNIIVHF